MRESLIEVRMSDALAVRLGAFRPISPQEHAFWRARPDCLLVRDPRTMQVVFWPIVPGADQSRSSA